MQRKASTGSYTSRTTWTERGNDRPHSKYKEHGFKQLEGMQQGSEEVVLTESIVKRIRSEHEDVEHMSERKKKIKKKNKAKVRKSDDTA